MVTRISDSDCIKDVDFIRRGQNMKKKQTKEKWLSYLLTCTALISVTSTAHAEATISVPKTGFVTHSSTHSPLSSVYSDTAYYQQTSGKTGQELKQALHHIIDHHTELPYDAVWDALRNTDEDPTNPNNILLLYTGRSQGKFTNGANTGQWNREHVWAKSHGNFGTEKGAGTDLHHLKPADVTVNSARGNLDFDEGGTKHPLATNCKYTTTSWEPPDQVKGDIARMLFYMAVRYEGDHGEIDLELNDTVNRGQAPYMGKLATLLKWHEQDPVDAFETRRNDMIYSKYQHNRNPFIDHPEWVQAIWK